MTLLLYGMRGCRMHCSRTHTQQHKMTDDNRTKFEFSDNLGSNVSMYQKDSFFTIESKKVSFRGHQGCSRGRDLRDRDMGGRDQDRDHLN